MSNDQLFHLRCCIFCRTLAVRAEKKAYEDGRRRWKQIKTNVYDKGGYYDES